MDNSRLVQQVRYLAEELYDNGQGFDTLVECYTNQEIGELLESEHLTTLKQFERYWIDYMDARRECGGFFEEF